ncbi:MAG: hypothetical protein ABI700_31360 [Chloroflexota bacterium]
MANYGIKLVWGGYRTYLDKVVGFSSSAYERWKDEINLGTRMLLYETSRNKGAQAIVSEVEVVEGFENTAKLNLLSPTEEHDHLVRIKVIRNIGSVPIITRKRVQEVLGRPSFPQQNDSWTPISETTYRHLLSGWSKR